MVCWVLHCGLHAGVGMLRPCNQLFSETSCLRSSTFYILWVTVVSCILPCLSSLSVTGKRTLCVLTVWLTFTCHRVNWNPQRKRDVLMISSLPSCLSFCEVLVLKISPRNSVLCEMLFLRIFNLEVFAWIVFGKLWFTMFSIPFVG